ncbi:hypothetical protein [Clostridium sp.]
MKERINIIGISEVLTKLNSKSFYWSRATASRIFFDEYNKRTIKTFCCF